MTLVLHYILTAIVFFIIDMIWLGGIAKKIYRTYLGDRLAKKVNWTAAIIFYLIFVLGIMMFAVWPSLETERLIDAAVAGGLFGFFTYATYDLTNLATLKKWPLPIVFIDITWGVVLAGLVSMAGFMIGQYI